MLKDYGLYMVENKLAFLGNETLEYNFYDVNFYGLDMLSLSEFSIMINTEFNGEKLALSLDFDTNILSSMLEQIPQAQADSIMQDIENAQKTNKASVNFTIPFIAKNIEAHIGKLQHGTNESFIPFVITKVEI